MSGGVRGQWQRCQVQFQQNAQAYIPKDPLKREVAAKIHSIFKAGNLAPARALLGEAVQEYRASAPRLAAWMEETLPDGFTVSSFPEGYRRVLRISNGLEWVNKEVHRMFRVVGSFVSEASCLRLASADLIEISDEWQTGRVHLAMEGKDENG